MNEMDALNNSRIYKSSSGYEIPERDVTYLLFVYLFTIELRMTHPLPEHSSKVLTSKF